MALLKTGSRVVYLVPGRPDSLEAATSTVACSDEAEDAHERRIACFRIASGNGHVPIHEERARVGDREGRFIEDNADGSS